jgi:hypothetical protein
MWGTHCYLSASTLTDPSVRHGLTFLLSLELFNRIESAGRPISRAYRLSLEDETIRSG